MMLHVDVQFWKAVSEADLTELHKVLADHPHYNYLWWKSWQALTTRNEDGETALHIATQADNAEMVWSFMHGQ